MKLCLVCNHASPRDAATCPKCGEASWKLLEPIAVEPQLAEVVPSAEAFTSRRKRGGK